MSLFHEGKRLEYRYYWNIMLPLSRPILSALAVFFFLVNWNAFLWPLTITTDQNLWLVQLAIASFQNQYSAARNYIMAASVVPRLFSSSCSNASWSNQSRLLALSESMTVMADRRDILGQKGYSNTPVRRRS